MIDNYIRARDLLMLPRLARRASGRKMLTFPEIAS